MRRRETGVVSNFFRQRCYGFVTREGKESSFSTDVQLHIENAKGDKLKDYVRKQGLLPGQQIRYTLDFEEHKGKGYAANWELVKVQVFRQVGARGAAGLPPTVGIGRLQGAHADLPVRVALQATVVRGLTANEVDTGGGPSPRAPPGGGRGLGGDVREV
eukprot:CAMPEP_0194525740 /NCGR_PEP_ID=MMETSP0253-20130528/61330_1 /TAXON_ID=2966 /ORGANISM="Noctiluca scintillans" /LENGTH=158 /DNA_ID=CAMNT_0039370505 /DNA_START=110 /DNA_END=583 /DNA_ORIENTATION=-